MAKKSLSLVFAMVMVCVALHSVMGEENPWKTVIDEASKAGVSPETISEAEKAIEDGSAQQAAEDALGSSSLNDWVQQANDMAKKVNPSIEVPIVLPDDEVEVGESPSEAPHSAPFGAPIGAPSPESSSDEGAPIPTPSEAPQAQSPNAPTPQA